MADNVQITAGSGTTIATDDVGGSQYQRMKLSDGTPDSQNHAKVDAAGGLWVTMNDIKVALGNLLNALVRPLWINPITGAARTEIQSGTVTTVTTCATVTSLSQLGGFAVKDVMIDQLMRASWAQNVRGRIA